MAVTVPSIRKKAVRLVGVALTHWGVRGTLTKCSQKCLEVLCRWLRKARQQILFTGLCGCSFSSPAFGIKRRLLLASFHYRRFVNSIAPPVTPNPGDLVEHSAAAIHLTFDIDSARLFFDEQTGSQTIVKAILQQRPRPHSYVLLALRHPTV